MTTLKVFIATVLLVALFACMTTSSVSAAKPRRYQHDMHVLKQLLKEIIQEGEWNSEQVHEEVDNSFIPAADMTSMATSSSEFPCAVAATPFRSEKSIDEFIATVTTNPQQLLSEFGKFILTPSFPFSLKQALKILQAVAATQPRVVRKHVTESLLKRLMDMKSNEAIGLIQSVSDRDWERFKLLELLVSNIVDLPTNREYVLMALFNDPIVKEKASLLLNEVKLHDCAMGAYNSLASGSRVLFVLERSDSMMYSKLTYSSSVSRYDFAKYHLIQLLKQLPATTLFNVVSYHEKIFTKFDQFVPATPQNIELVAKSPFPSSGTSSSSINLEESLKNALKLFTPALSQQMGNNTVYLLSCGPGNRGEFKDAEKLADSIREYAEMARAPVNAIAFTIGSEHFSVSNAEAYREMTSRNLNAIAYATGGFFRRN
ncbi:hypothetical protein C9374_001120 [Naegleria lovaniensis]|uniref:VWFA domain-containing protein n=1 Tax=Naegleria lovaniensis TaxID=51637 RepID=A0AA88GSF9_NAELO|nr:uncharacterized protein C9374_001120 [Naegleria lovaniensis]KAG2387526.1 hypothetical protein C9374_001120 [Naegleria lovaniensis]